MYAQVSNIFQYQKDLLSEFEQFLPEATKDHVHEVFGGKPTDVPDNQQKSYSQVTSDGGLGKYEEKAINNKISKLPECIRLSLGDNYDLYQIQADGACFLRTISMVLFQTENPHDLAVFINQTMVNNHDLFFTDYNRSYPAELIYGCGKVFIAKNLFEYKDFLRSEDGTT